jgi:hypothetical protein
MSSVFETLYDCVCTGMLGSRWSVHDQISALLIVGNSVCLCSWEFISQSRSWVTRVQLTPELHIDMNSR